MKTTRFSNLSRQELSGLKQLFYKYKSRAKQKFVGWELSLFEFLEVVGKDCYLCGIEPAQKFHYARLRAYFIYNGIDRIDNNDIYKMSNVAPCCGKCNMMKGTLSLSDFINQTKKIAKKRRHK